MKIKFLTGVLALCLAASSLSLAAEKTTKQQKANTEDLLAKDVQSIKTFDFERIFAEADRYFVASQNWQRLKCYPKTGFICSKRECPKIKLVENSAMILDKKSKTLALCQNQACRYFPASFEQTGVFINVQVPESTGIYIRVLGDNRFKEIAMVGLDAYITNGECDVIDGNGNKIPSTSTEVK